MNVLNNLPIPINPDKNMSITCHRLKSHNDSSSNKSSSKGITPSVVLELTFY